MTEKHELAYKNQQQNTLDGKGLLFELFDNFIVVLSKKLDGREFIFIKPDVHLGY